ncbi:MAG: porin, partial [Dyadobacter sp.]
MKKVYCTVLSLMIPFLGFSKSGLGEEKKTKTTETAKIEEVKEEGEEGKGSFAFSGYLDSYYMANFNKPASRS